MFWRQLYTGVIFKLQQDVESPLMQYASKHGGTVVMPSMLSYCHAQGESLVFRNSCIAL